MKTKVAVVDGDPLAREKTLRYLRAEPDVEVVGAWAWSDEAAARIRQAEPDVVFLDVQTPHMCAAKVWEAMEFEHAPAVVFIATYDPPLVHAFETHRVQYLLKPFDAERFRNVLESARTRRAQPDGREEHECAPAFRERLAG